MKPNQKITIPLSQSDLEELLHDKSEFDWTFPTESGEFIDVHIINEDTIDEDEDEDELEEDRFPKTDEEEQFQRDAMLGISPFKKNNER